MGITKVIVEKWNERKRRMKMDDFALNESL